jgi:hypothetical protein
VYQITHSSEGKIVKYSPYQVEIKDLKDLKHVVATRIVDDISKLYRFETFGSSSLKLIFIAHSNDSKKFGHVNYHSFQQLCN